MTSVFGPDDGDVPRGPIDTAPKPDHHHRKTAVLLTALGALTVAVPLVIAAAVNGPTSTQRSSPPGAAAPAPAAPPSAPTGPTASGPRRPPTAPRVPDRYREVALGFTGQVTAVNDRGDLVGTRVFSGAIDHPFLWRNDTLIDLGQLEPTWDGSGTATDINNRGEIVGVSVTGFKPPLAYERAFIWRNGVMSALTAPGTDSTANAINDHGVVVGNLTVDGVSHAFVWQDGVLTDLGAGQAMDVNNRGQIAGGNDNGPWIYERGRFTYLPTGRAEHARIMAMNSAGWAVGTGQLERDGDMPEQRALLWRSGRIIDLGKIGVGQTYPVGINDRGQILGVTNRNDLDEPIPFLWQNGVMIDLSAHGVPRTHLMSCIDDRGRLIANAAGQYKGQVVIYL